MGVALVPAFKAYLATAAAKAGAAAGVVASKAGAVAGSEVFKTGAASLVSGAAGAGISSILTPKPGTPKLPPPGAGDRAGEEASEAERRRRRNSGTVSTILGGRLGLPSSGQSVGAKILTGQ